MTGGRWSVKKGLVARCLVGNERLTHPYEVNELLLFAVLIKLPLKVPPCSLSWHDHIVLRQDLGPG